MRDETEAHSVDWQEQILSSISHDLKSPVCAIMGIANFLINEVSEKPEVNQSLLDGLKRISAASEQVLNLVSDITLMARLKAGNGFIEPYWVFNLKNELLDILETFSHEAASKKIVISHDIAGELPIALWDMRRLRYHAINNVISNAIKFTPNGGYVNISASHEDMNLVIRVEDNGPGIPHHETKGIFIPFKQYDLTSVRVHKSAGLGLSNAKRYVELHGGIIYVDETYTDGAAIVMELPERAIVTQSYTDIGRQEFLFRSGEEIRGAVYE